jgi:hypothetical protein
MAVELWCQGASHKLFQSLNHMGLSLGVNAARNYVDKLASQHDSKLRGWQTAVGVSAR